MTDTSEFLSRYPRRPGKLAAWQAVIVDLIKAGASYRMVCRFLAEQGVKADPGEVRRFMFRCGRQRLIGAPRQAAGSKKEPAAKATTDLPKFEWPPAKRSGSSW